MSHIRTIGNHFLAIGLRQTKSGRWTYVKARRETCAHFGWDQMKPWRRYNPEPGPKVGPYNATAFIPPISLKSRKKGMIYTDGIVLRFKPGTRFSYGFSGQLIHKDLVWLAMHTRGNWTHMTSVCGRIRPREWWEASAISSFGRDLQLNPRN